MAALVAGVVTWGVLGAFAAGTPVDLTTAGASSTVNGALWQEGGAGAGTGNFNPFLWLKSNTSTEKGYNSCAGPEFETECTDTHTHPVAAAGIPTVTIGGVKYRQISLDSNEQGNEDHISIDQFKVYLSDVNNLNGYNDATETFSSPSGNTTSKIYDLDGAGDRVVLMRSQTLEPGSGKSDITVNIPDSLFPPECFYGSTTCNKFVVVFSALGGAGNLGVGAGCTQANPCDYGVTSGFEEWRTELAPVVNVDKTANATSTLTHHWTVKKYVSVDGGATYEDASASINLFSGDTKTITWKIVATKDPTPPTAGSIQLSGTVTITNPTGVDTGPIPDKIPALVQSITDVVNQGSDVPVTLTGAGCNPTAAAPTTIAANSSLTCNYTKTLTTTTPGTNTATATLTTPAPPATPDSFSKTVPITFAAPTETDSTATLDDDFKPTGFPATLTGSSEVVYTTNESCGQSHTNTNTAVLDPSDTAPITDPASIVVNCKVLTVSKTANTSFTRTFKWKITKTVTPQSLNMFKGDTGQVQWEVKVEPDSPASVDSDFKVTGTITVTSPAGAPTRAVGVSDMYAGSVAGSLSNCKIGATAVTLPHDLAAGETLTCDYVVNLLSAASGQNVATATVANIPSGTTNFTGSATATFGAPTTKVNETVHVTDTNGHTFPAVTGAGIDEKYTQNFTCNADAGSHKNTATITETGQSSDATATVTCNELTVSKTGTGSFTRTYKWKIDKTVDPATLNMFKGDSGTVQWDVKVTPDSPAFVDSGAQVAGTITVTSPAGAPSRSVSLTDLYNNSISGTLSNCKINGGSVITLPATLAGGQTLTCDYVVATQADGTNVATATIPNLVLGVPTGTTSYTGSKAVVFGAATTEVNKTVHVTDTNGHVFPAGGVTSPASLDEKYPQTFTCNTDAGSHKNTATITETGQSDDATATVNCSVLTTDKTATPSYTRTWTWTVAKTSTHNTQTIELSVGQTLLEPYSVTYGATKADTLIKVSGSITVSSPAGAPNNRTVTISDVYSGGGTLAIGQCTVAGGDTGNVANPYTDLDAGETVTCPYTITLTSVPTASATNTATATLANIPSGTTPFSSAAKTVTFGAPTTETGESVTISDNVPPGAVCNGLNTPVSGCTAGNPPPTGVPSGTLTATAPGPFSKTFTYTRIVGPFTSTQCGDHNVDNTAGFTVLDTAATGTSSVHFVVQVPCPVGCTLTQGYWKTHSIKGPAPFDANWNNVPSLPYAPADSYVPLGGTAENLAFFYSGQTWYQVFWTSPKGGNAYYILAHQYMAAVLNILKATDPATPPPEVVTALNSALALFKNPLNTPLTVGSLKNGARNVWVNLASTLEAFNSGQIGPGHCAEDNTSSDSP